MRGKLEFVFLALLGLLLVVLSANTQVAWIDLAQHSLIENFQIQIHTWAWWTIVGVPMLAGVAFLVAAFGGFRSRLSRSWTIRFFLGCEVFSAALILITSYGILATVFCGLI